MISTTYKYHNHNCFLENTNHFFRSKPKKSQILSNFSKIHLHFFHQFFKILLMIVLVAAWFFLCRSWMISVFRNWSKKHAKSPTVQASFFNGNWKFLHDRALVSWNLFTNHLPNDCTPSVSLNYGQKTHEFELHFKKVRNSNFLILAIAMWFR